MSHIISFLTLNLMMKVFFIVPSVTDLCFQIKFVGKRLPSTIHLLLE